MITLHLKTNKDLRTAESVKVVFFRDGKELLYKTGDDLYIIQSEVSTTISAEELQMWEPGRFIAAEIHAVIDGVAMESNAVYRSMDTTRTNMEYSANAFFGNDKPHHSDVVDTSDATLENGSQMLAPYTAYARGEKITGTMQKYDGAVMPFLGSIAVITMPTKTVYEDGEDIDLAGVVIKGIYPNGEPWEGDEDHPGGAIPISELSFAPQKADRSAATPVVYTNDEETLIAIKCVLDVDGHSPYDDSFHIWFQYAKDLGNRYTITNSGTIPGDIQYLTKYNNRIYAAAESSQYCDLGRYPSEGQDTMPSRIRSGIATTGVGEFKPISTLDGYAEYMELVPESTADPENIALSSIHKEGGEQTISLSWPRVGDGLELQTEFKIEVPEQGD